MNSSTFRELVLMGQERTRALVLGKEHEYTSDDTDRLEQFKRAGAMDNETAEKALWGFLKKHLTSLAMMIDRIEQGETIPFEKMQEKTGDVIVYSHLLEGLTIDRLEEEQGWDSTVYIKKLRSHLLDDAESKRRERKK